MSIFASYIIFLESQIVFLPSLHIHTLLIISHLTQNSFHISTPTSKQVEITEITPIWYESVVNAISVVFYTKFLTRPTPSKGYVNAETKLETTLTVEYSYKYNFHSISLLFMATNALIFSLISLREERHLHKTQINNVKFFINFDIKPNGGEEVVGVLTRNLGSARKKWPGARSINKFSLLNYGDLF